MLSVTTRSSILRKLAANVSDSPLLFFAVASFQPSFRRRNPPKNVHRPLDDTKDTMHNRRRRSVSLARRPKQPETRDGSQPSKSVPKQRFRTPGRAQLAKRLGSSSTPIPLKPCGACAATSSASVCRPGSDAALYSSRLERSDELLIDPLPGARSLRSVTLENVSRDANSSSTAAAMAQDEITLRVLEVDTKKILPTPFLRQYFAVEPTPGNKTSIILCDPAGPLFPSPHGDDPPRIK